MTVRYVILPFTPRAWQVPLIDDPAKRIVAVVHRRAGKSTGLMWRGIKRALTIKRTNPPPRVVHTLPVQVQWSRTGMWDALARAGSLIPGAQVFKSEMRLILPNGAIYQAGGMDKPDSWRGGSADEVILDEYDDTHADGQATAIEPMLADFGGVLVRSGRPKGYGRLKAAYERAGTQPGWSRYLLRYQDTGVSRLDVLGRLGVRPVKIVPAMNPIERINALRMMLARSRFDAVKCRMGLKSLWHYRREWNPAAEVFRPNPVHDWSSHATPMRAMPLWRGTTSWMGM